MINFKILRRPIYLFSFYLVFMTSLSYAYELRGILPFSIIFEDEKKACAQDSDCNSDFKVCEENLCEHKYIFPQQTLEVIGIIILSLMMMLSTMAGIGGGGVVVPLLMTFFQFEPKEASCLSGFSIVLCQLTRFTYNFRQKHPQKDAIVIDYSLAIVMLPTVLMGSFIGVLINTIFPDVILLSILTLLLCYLTYQSGEKAVQIFKKENTARKQ